MDFYRPFCFILTFFTVAIINITAQDFNTLPKLLPAYSEDFSDIKSNPSMCFDNVLVDASGRMWLTPCTGTLTGLHLFQFDGYEFRAVRGSLDSLPTDTKFVLMDQKQRLVGYVNEIGNQQVVLYSPRTDQLLSYALPAAGAGKIYKVFIDKDGVLNLYLELEGNLLHYQLKEEQAVLVHKFEKEFINDRFLINVLGENESGVWYWSPSCDQVYQLDTETKKRKVYSLTGVDFPATDFEDTPPFVGELYPINGANYLSLYYVREQRSVLFKQTAESKQFDLMKGLPLTARDIQVFSDESGNVVFLLLLPNNEYRAILEDPEGRRYDYSAFLPSQLIQGTNPILKSPNFKQQLLVCHSQGILLQTVKAFDAITRILPGNGIRAMVELPGQKTFISTQQPFERFLYENRTGQMALWDNPTCNLSWAKLLKDKDGFIWGVSNQGFVKYDPINNTCENYAASITKNVIALAGDDRIAFTREGHLAFFDLKSKRILSFNVNGEPLTIPGVVHDMLYSKSGLLWIATTKGMVKVDVEHQTAEIIGLSEPFLDFRFLCIHEDEKGWLWLGTTLGGIHLYNPSTGELKILNSEEGLANNTVVSILADDDGDRWVGTYNGISIISAAGRLKVNLFEEDGLVDREANRYAYLKTSDGKLLIGTVNGLNVIDPQKVKQRLSSNKDLKIYLNTISYFDAHESRSVSKRYGLDNMGMLTLPANRRHLLIKFAVSNYFKPEHNQYAYQLEGISNGWVPLGNQNSLNLSNMPSGRYRLLIKGSDGTGNWTAQPLVIRIHVEEYFYKQIWFYVLCITLIGGLVFLWIQRLQSAVKKATKTILEDKEIIEQQAEKLLELDQAKSRFFTNISHEFRTPLTIISGMASEFMNNPQEWAKRGGEMIKQNSANLLNLVNQILDLRKLETRELKINLVQADVVPYLRYLIQPFESYAQRKGLQLHFLPVVEKLVMDFDPEKLLRIISNLLSNAIKFNRDTGHVYIRVQSSVENGQSFLQLQVEDNGIGIPADKLPNIFDRFFQVDNSGTRTGEGTGIGLALTRELVQLLGGRIEAKSMLDVGTTFTLWLPVTNNAPTLSEAEFEELSAVKDRENPIIGLAGFAPQDEEIAEPISNTGQPHLLIVEDNASVRQYLIACLRDYYQLTLAENGQTGIEKAIELIPDLIVSDVMMPEKDGFELTAFLKNDRRTDHIPIVLLTAKADFDSRISGLEKGADAYIVKPFEKRELLVRLEKLFELRQKLQAHYAKLVDSDNATETLSLPEQPFLQTFYNLVEEELSNPDFNMDQLCQAFGMSRSQLYKKLKALTGKSGTALIRSFRLQRSKQLLTSSDLSVTEVAYTVGFSSLSYFSSAFVEEFGVRPSAFRGE